MTPTSSVVLGVAAVLALATSAAAEPPCTIPTCMTSITDLRDVKQVLVSGDGKTVARIVEADTVPRMVLVEIVRGGAPDPIVPAFVIGENKDLHLVPFGGDLTRPMVVFSAVTTWASASAATLTGGIALTVDPRRTTALKPRSELATYRAQERRRNAEQEHTYAADKLTEGMAEVNAACHTTITYQLDWTKLPDTAFEDGLRDAAYICEDNFQGLLVNTCADDAGRTKVHARVKTVVCRYKASGSLAIELRKDGTLLIEPSITADRERQGAKAARYLMKRF